METKPSSDNGARRTNTDVCCSGNGSVMVSLQLRFRRSPSGSCSLGRLDGFIPFATIFLPILLACNRRCMGVNGKLKWLVHGGNYRENDSTLPRLLMAVYTPLLRCATAAISSPFCISGLVSAYALEPFFLFSAHRFFIMSDNRLLPAGVRRSPSLLLRGLGTALVFAADCGDCPSSAAMARLSQSGVFHSFPQFSTGL
jgi:hypothetical protein